MNLWLLAMNQEASHWADSQSANQYEARLRAAAGRLFGHAVAERRGRIRHYDTRPWRLRASPEEKSKD